MRKFTLWPFVLLLAACDVFQGGAPRPRAKLSEREFIDVYVALARAREPGEKARILQQHGTSEKEMQEFVRAYTDNLPALSAVFDSVVARQGAQSGLEVPTLP